MPLEKIKKILDIPESEKWISPLNRKRFLQFVNHLHHPEDIINDQLMRNYPVYLAENMANNLVFLTNIYENYSSIYALDSNHPLHQKIIKRMGMYFSENCIFFPAVDKQAIELYKLAGHDLHTHFIAYKSVTITTLNSNVQNKHRLYAPQARPCFPTMNHIEALIDLNPITTTLLQDGIHHITTKEGYICQSYRFAATGNIENLKTHYATNSQAINKQSPAHGITDLHVACYFGKFKTANALIQMGADPTLLDANNHLAFEYALRGLGKDKFFTSSNKIDDFLNWLFATVSISENNSEEILWHAITKEVLNKKEDAFYKIEEILRYFSEVLQDKPCPEVENFIEAIKFLHTTLAIFTQKLILQEQKIATESSSKGLVNALH